MGKYDIGLILLSRPFEVWLAAYMLLQVIERKEIMSWVNYVLAGINAFATLAGLYGMIFIGADGNKSADLWRVLVASSVVIWIYWIFVLIYGHISNNKRGITISISDLKLMDRVMLYVVSPLLMLIFSLKFSDVIAYHRHELFGKFGIIMWFLGSFLIIAMNIGYLVTLKARLDYYIVFGKKEIEVWRKDREKLYKYSNISSIEQLAQKTMFTCKYKLEFSKNNNEDTVVVDDDRIEIILDELIKLNNRKKGGKINGRKNNS